MMNYPEVARAFDAAVNMTPAALENWLKTDESNSVGWVGGKTKSGAGGPESVGHKSGGRILQILRKAKDELTDADYDHMRKVTGYVRRHCAQRPTGDIEHSRWRYSLMNWGHEPLKP